jgi:hypothetical protein
MSIGGGHSTFAVEARFGGNPTILNAFVGEDGTEGNRKRM